MESEFRLSQENWARLQDLVAETLERPLEERESFLNQRCQGDVSLRHEAESLITAFTQSGNFLDQLDAGGIQRLLEVTLEIPEGQVGPYRILRLLGRGGMGIVYLAEDTRLDRRVALKFLPIHLASHADANNRLVAEAKMAAALDHPNIGVVHEIGQTQDGQVFIAMAYYEGDTLRERIRGRRLSLAEVVDLAGQIARGLSAAHLQGCIHCDIKPSNILISGGDSQSREAELVKIVDFGIAKSLSDDMEKRSRDTSGTVAYMSPERTSGSTVDLRTDVWSLGVVLYEMLTGRQPFQAKTVPRLIEVIQNEEPDAVGTLRPDIPAVLEIIIRKCLRKDPAERYSDAEAFLTDLEQFNASRLGNRSPGNEQPRKRTVISGRIAVLPLENLSPDREDEYFALATTDELISRLSRLKGLRVIGRTSSLSYAATKKRIAEIGMDLGVYAIVSGSVRKEGEKLRIFLNFTESATEELLWSEVFDGKTEDAIAVQQKIATRVSEALNLQMQPGERAKVFKTGTRQREAYECYLKGRYFLDKFDETSVTMARDHFQRALDIDPAFAEAWSGLADAYKMFDYFSMLSPKEAATRAKASAERALELDPDLAEGHASLATVLVDHYWDWEKAAHHYRTAIELSPGYPTGHQLHAEYLRDVGRFDEAMKEIQKAQELDPLSPFYELVEGTILLAQRRPVDAIMRFERAVEKQPNYPAVHVYLALAYLHVGRYETVIGMMETADPQADIPDAVALRGCALAKLGRIEEAHRMLDRLEKLSENRYIAPYHAALIHANLNDVEKALDYLEKTAQERSWFVRIFPLAPDFDLLRSHPRFAELLKRIGLNTKPVAGGL